MNTILAVLASLAQALFTVLGASVTTPQNPHAASMEIAGAANIQHHSFEVFGADPRVPPAPPAIKDVKPEGTGFVVSWVAPESRSNVTYGVYRHRGDSQPVQVSGDDLHRTTSFTDAGLTPGADYSYSVVAIDGEGNRSEPSRTATEQANPRVASTPFRAKTCPPPTIRVDTEAEIQSALDTAEPGDVVWIEDGRYDLAASLSRSGTPDDPLWICGSRDAVLSQSVVGQGGYGLHLNEVSDVVVAGFSVQNAQKGVMADSGTRVVVADLSISQTDHEGIHLRQGTSDSHVVGNHILYTGRESNRAYYGEGIYVGSSRTAACDTACPPDQSNNNLIEGNTIRATTAEPIEVKEDVIGGVVRDNTVDGSFMDGKHADALISIRGHSILVEGNVGTNSPRHGFHSLRYSTDNHFSNNSVDGVAEHAFSAHPHTGAIIACNNDAEDAGDGDYRIPCKP